MSATIRKGLNNVANRENSIPLSKSKNVNGRKSVVELLKKPKVTNRATKVGEEITIVDETVQTLEQASSSCQTDVSCLDPVAEVTIDDLTAEEPSVNYWRTLVENREREIDNELEKSFNLSIRLDDSVNEVDAASQKITELIEVLKNVTDDQFFDDNEYENE